MDVACTGVRGKALSRQTLPAQSMTCTGEHDSAGRWRLRKRLKSRLKSHAKNIFLYEGNMPDEARGNWKVMNAESKVIDLQRVMGWPRMKMRISAPLTAFVRVFFEEAIKILDLRLLIFDWERESGFSSYLPATVQLNIFAKRAKKWLNSALRCMKGLMKGIE